MPWAVRVVNHSTEPAACEYFHRARRTSQFSGAMVQFSVCWIAAKGIEKKTTRAPTIQTRAAKVGR